MVPENRRATPEIFGKEEEPTPMQRVCAQRRLLQNASRPFTGLPKIAGQRPRFLGKRSCRRLRKQLAPCASCCEIRRAPTRVPKNRNEVRFLGKRRNRRQYKEFVRSADSCKTRRAPLQGSRKSQGNARDFWERGVAGVCANSLRPARAVAKFAEQRRGCGGRIRTCDLRVMSPTSYRTAPPRDKTAPMGNAI